MRMNFNPNKLLSSNLVIKSIDSHLYSIGLSLFKNGNFKRRNFQNPVFMFIIQLQIFIRQCISLSVFEENPEIFVYIGDVGYFIKARYHYAVACGLIMLISLISQILHFINYKKSIKPSYMRPFEMMSGLTSPQSIGLNDEEEIRKMIRISKYLFKVCKILPLFMFCLIFTLTFWIFIHNFSLKQMMVFGMAYSILNGMIGFYANSIIISQIVYFYIICYYLKLKIKRINERIENIFKNENTIQYKFDSNDYIFGFNLWRD